ncbi:MAG: 3,4-dihydroxy-2-butanone-4-phosphate synthase [Saprospiraceae bacterium]|jgi:3,4-dihydroxy 2-butanone 4-phosphate synthase/GTP cyclohydrolase II|nr:3,4-dihydroxy-2-butanone-4-phosphate synthase [Saprospiraceae bacterium]MBP8213561.1 3,4-dihydroxy-2-butanone-4-phosphate synthase [Saprospiraceae bacterium]MBP9055930.1 3,4-dihydroxy-2-butanone-4-phosphate synthase [Saprospiraceae bacterium]HMT54313.1 3,4-dihydroxy-2-butanone-4-phosphate synthase [Saprospiraceae bacterium]HMT71693.1 3,4-dihydroxy-2-butanone-4-phosphate synthase [Saprospiraceae bacterium]
MFAETITEPEIRLNTIEEAIEDIKSGKILIVVDDEDRENEGDFICAAEKITPELVNFMAKHGRGLICTPILEQRAKELDLDLMVKSNTAMHNTAFTVSIDLIGQGCTTGISAYDRATGIKAIINPDTKPTDFARPGHIFPLIAKQGGVLRRTGHTEAAVDLARLADCYPAGVLVEILNEDGSMARLPQLIEISRQLSIKIISIKDLVAYRMRTERLVSLEMETEIDTTYGKFAVKAFRQLTTGDVHLAFTMGEINDGEPTLVRVHSNTETGDILGILFDGYAEQLSRSLQIIAKAKKGVLLFMRHHEGDTSILDKLKALDNNPKNNPPASDEQRDFGTGAQILRELGITKIKLISNHTKKRIGLIGYGLEISEHVYLD